MVLQGVAAFGHIAPPVVVYAKQPEQHRGSRALMCFPTEYTEYVFCVNAAGNKWDVAKRFRDFVNFEKKLTATFSESDLEGREPLPEKNFFLSNSPSFVEHRRWRLEMYINSLAHCPVVAHSDAFKEFLEYDEQKIVSSGGDDAFAGLTAYDREQERIKMERLAALAKMPLRSSVQAENSTSSVPTPQGFSTGDQWAWAGDALSLERQE
mmetsp:Transcript_24836/g.56061  ORF Transcript_24836/g.56061 Transcript_24836/m.56061 type:complete len:209 (-) Transcript_24836:111-737(-)